jgi:hypothetical protein
MSFPLFKHWNVLSQNWFFPQLSQNIIIHIDEFGLVINLQGKREVGIDIDHIGV